MEGLLVDFTTLADDKAASTPSMLATIFSTQHQTVFLKLTGSKALLKAEKANFETLAGSLHIH